MTLLINETASGARLPVAPWRLIESYGASGALNMALDETLLDAVAAGGQPIVRFYTWSPTTLSLGVNQALGEVDAAACASRGFDLVRRLTGGRAVLHQYELTYSVIARENDPRVSGGVIESYRKISAALVEGLNSLGMQVQLSAPDPKLLQSIASARRQAELAGDTGALDNSHAVCFDTASAYELTAGGKKLVGSAQARRGGALLQHGSILLDIDWDAWVNVFAYATEAGKQRAYTKLPSRMTSLREQLGREISPEEVVAALYPAFERTLHIDLEPSEPSDGEWTEACRLAAEKYSSAEWLAHR